MKISNRLYKKWMKIASKELEERLEIIEDP